MIKSKKSETTSSKKSPPFAKATGDKQTTATKTSGKPMTMEELLDSTGYKIPILKRGQEVKGKVLSVNRSEILVDIGAKSEGIVYGREIAANPDLLLSLSKGDTIEATVIYPENEQGQVVLSLRKHSGDKRWGDLDAKKDSGEVIDVVAMEVNRGGIICEYFGLRGFLPSSQLSQIPSKLGDLVGKRLNVSVIEADRAGNRLIFTQKQQGGRDIEQIRKQLANIKVGEKYKGVITAILPFGIFVEITVEGNKSIKSNEGNKGKKAPETIDTSNTSNTSDTSTTSKIEGLVHLSEIAWEKTADPTSGFTVGQEVEVVVVSKDEEAGRLNLSIKQLLPDPFARVMEQFARGQKVSGKVAKVTPYGVFVSLEAQSIKGNKSNKGNGGEAQSMTIDGLMHISKIPPTLSLNVGDLVECEVENIDSPARRVSLVPVVKEKPVLYR